MGLKLTIELVPKSCHGQNLRTLCPEEWDLVRSFVLNRAAGACEICGWTGELECHEVWRYDDDRKLQILDDVIALCEFCHWAKHYGRARRIRKDKTARHQLKKINGWSNSMLDRYISSCFRKCAERGRYSWTLSLKWYEDWRRNHGSICSENR